MSSSNSQNNQGLSTSSQNQSPNQINTASQINTSSVQNTPIQQSQDTQTSPIAQAKFGVSFGPPLPSVQRYSTSPDQYHQREYKAFSPNRQDQQATISEMQELLNWLWLARDSPATMEAPPRNTNGDSSEKILVPSFNLDEYKDQVAQFYGPKKEQLRQQLMSQRAGKYENYISFIHKLQELAVFAQVFEQQLLFVLECRLPKNIAGYIKDCNIIQQYTQKLQTVFQEGWFNLIDDQFRQTIQLNSSKRQDLRQKKGDGQEGLDSHEQGQQQQEAEQQNRGPKNAVAFLGVENNFESYPIATRGVRKQQHIDKDPPPQFINQSHRDCQQYQQQQQQQRQQQNPQQQQPQQPQQQQQQYSQQPQQSQQQNPQSFNQNAQSPTGQNGYEQGINTQHRQQQGPNIEDSDALKKLFEKAKYNAQFQNPLGDKINKGQRGRRVPRNFVEEDRNIPRPVILDAQRYLNQAQQVNLNQVLKDVCVLVPLVKFFNMIGFELQKKQNQNIPNNVAYYQQVGTTVCDASSSQANIPPISQSQQNCIQIDNSSPNLNDAFSKQQIYQFFYQSLLDQQPQLQQQSSDPTFIDYLKTSENTEHLCIPININDKRIISIIDSGAQQTILSLRAVEQAGITNLIEKQPDSDQNIAVTRCTGKDKILGVIPRLEVEMQGYLVAWKDVFVQQNSTFDLLVGLDVLGLFEFEFSIKDRVVSFISYPDDPRVVLNLCNNSPTNSQNS